MKKILFGLLLTSASLAGNTQNLTNALPGNASLVIRYAGGHLNQQLPVAKIDAYGFLQQEVFAKLGLDSTRALQSSGIDFSKDSYQYLVTDDSCTSFVTLLPLSNEAAFVQTIQQAMKKDLEPTGSGNHKLVSLSGDTYLGWNGQQAVVVYASHTKPVDYYLPYSAEPMVDSAVVVPDTSEVLMEMPVEGEASVTEEVKPAVTVKRTEKKSTTVKKPVAKKPVVKKPAKKAANGAGKVKSQKAKAKKGSSKGKPVAKKKAAPKPKPVQPPTPVIEEVVIADLPAEDMSVEEVNGEDSMAATKAREDSIEDARKSEWYRVQDSLLTMKQSRKADSLIALAFNPAAKSSLLTSPDYQKVIDAHADMSLYFNYDNLVSELWSTVWSKMYGTTGMMMPSAAKTGKGFSSGTNLFFEDNRVRVQQNTWSADAEMMKMAKGMYDNRQKKSLAGYITPGNIGYFSGSLNTEAASHYYYKLMRDYLGHMPVLGPKDMTDAYIDLLELIIDEKAIAELLPGNFVMVLHKVGTKKVTYSTYEYDDDFNQKEVQKTKDELSPDFTIAIATKNPSFLNRLLRLPVKYSDSSFHYSAKEGYYEWQFNPEKDAISQLFMAVQNDRLVLTTSRDILQLTLRNSIPKLSKDMRRKIFRNNYSFYLHTNELIDQVGRDMNTASVDKIKTYLKQNLGDLEMDSKFTNGMIVSNGYLSIKGNHRNSLEFFFNLVEQINKIMDEEKHTIDVEGVDLEKNDN